MTAEQKKEQKIRLLKAKVAVALQDELGRVPKTEEIEQVDLRRFRGLFKTENSARKGEHCHEQTLPTHRNFAEKLSGWLELPMRSILSPGSPVKSVSPMAPCEAGSTRMR